MYRRVNSGRFIGLTTAGIVIVMAVFTWVMYGMAQQVYTMTDVMVELNESFKSMVITQTSMAKDMHDMSGNIVTMTSDISQMSKNVGAMSGSVALLSDAMLSMAGNLNRMTYDVGQATYAVTNPMSYMWGNPFPF